MQIYQKETQTQVFFCEYCKIFKNSFFYRTLPVAASEVYERTLSLFLVDKASFLKLREIYNKPLKAYFAKSILSKTLERKELVPTRCGLIYQKQEQKTAYITKVQQNISIRPPCYQCSQE